MFMFPSFSQEPTPTPTTMDYEQDEQEEQFKEQAENHKARTWR